MIKSSAVIWLTFLYALVVGCASPPMDVTREWTLLDQPRAEVEAALTKAGYFEVEKRTWGSRSSSQGIDRYSIWPDSTGVIVAVNRMRILFDTVAAKRAFDQELSVRTDEFGKPVQDESVDDPMNEERSITWKTEDSEGGNDIALSLRGKQWISTASALPGALNMVRDKLLGRP